MSKKILLSLCCFVGLCFLVNLCSAADNSKIAIVDCSDPVVLLDSLLNDKIAISGGTVSRDADTLLVKTNNNIQINISGDYPVWGTQLSFDYHIAASDRPRRVRIGKSGITRYLHRGQWQKLEFSLSDSWGGDLWRVQSDNIISNLSLSFEGNMTLSLRNFRIVSHPQFPFIKPEVLRVSSPTTLKQTIELSEEAKNGWLQIVATTDFRCLVNNQLVTVGQFNNIDAEKWPLTKSFFPLAKEAVWTLRSGESNVIAIELGENNRHNAEIAIAVGWDEGIFRKVLVSDSTWLTDQGQPESLGTIPTAKSKQFNNIIDIYPLLIPRLWDKQIYQPFALSDYPTWQAKNPILQPRVLAGKWGTMQLNGRYYLQDPQGQPFFVLGTQTCSILRLWGLRFAKYSYNTFSSQDEWVRHNYTMMQQTGFNCLTVTLPEGFYQVAKADNIPSFRFLSSETKRGEKLRHPSGKTIPHFHDPFDPAWREDFRYKIRELAAETAADPAIIGYFVDNEFPFDGSLHGRNLTGAVYSTSASQEFIQFLQQRYVTIDALNRAWYGIEPENQHKYHSDFAAIIQASVNPWEGEQSYPKGFICQDYPDLSGYSQRWQDFHHFAVYLTEVFAEQILATMREFFPDKLIGSNRFMGGGLDSMLAAYRNYDIIAWNAYPMEMWNRGTFSTRQIERMNQAHKVTGKPLIITEFNMQALDTSVNSTTANLENQQRRGEEFVRLIAQIGEELPAVAGIVHFSWMDSSEGEKANFGIIASDGLPYQDFIIGMQEGFQLLDEKILK